MEGYVFYIKGSVGWGYSNDGNSLASISAGVMDFTFVLPNMTGNDDYKFNALIGVSVLDANVSLGFGVNGTAEIISGTVGLKFFDTISIKLKGYVGAGLSFDLSKGFSIGGGCVFGWEFAIDVDWDKIFGL